MSTRFPAAMLLGFLAALPAMAAEAAEGNRLITPEFGLIFWTAVTFVLLVFVLGRFAWRPLVGAVEARERSIRESLEQARAEREQAEKLLREHRELVAQARRERADVVAAGQKDAERLKNEILEEARGQREHLLKQAEGQIRAEMRQARAELRAIAADLSIRVAERLVSRSLDGDAQRKLVEDYLDELEDMPDESNALRS